MTDWFRSISTLLLAFAAVVVLTIALAGVIVPSAGATGADGEEPAVPDAGGSASPVAAPSGPPTAIGGILTMTGDHDGAFRFDRESIQERYSILGDDGRIFFGGGHPPEVEQINLDGWDFFIDPGECELTPGDRHDPTGVAGLHIRCVDLEEVRDKGVATVEGTLGVAATVLGLRGDLPESGGTLQLGGETLTFEGAYLSVSPFGGAFAGQWVDLDQGAVVAFAYDPQTHGLSISEVQVGDDIAAVPRGACSVSERELGVLSPHARAAEMTIRCAGLEFPDLGTVPLEGTVIADIIDPPEPGAGF